MDGKKMRNERQGNDVRDAHRLRGIMYSYLLDEMERELGREKAQQAFRRATFRRGLDVRKQYGPFIEKGDFEGLARHFVESSPAGGSLFQPAIEKADAQCAVLTMSSCPLVAAWKDLGLPAERIKELCDAAYAIDFGTFESDRTGLSFTHRISAGDSMCRLIIQKK